MSEAINPHDPVISSYPKKIGTFYYFDLDGSIDNAIEVLQKMKDKGATDIEADMEPYELVFTRPYTKEEQEEKRKATKLMLDTAESARYQQYLRLCKEFKG